MTPDLIKELISKTFTDPRAAARQILDLNLPRNVVGMIFVLTCVLSAIVSFLVAAATVGADGVLVSPLRGAILVGAGTVVTSGIISFVGRMLGGTGQFFDLFVLILWSQIIQLGLSALSIIANVVSADLYVLVFYFSFAFGFWLMVNFTTVAHGFKSRPLVAMGIFGISFFIAFVLIIILNSAGLAPVPAGA